MVWRDPGLIGVKEGCSAAVLLLIFSSGAGPARRPLVAAWLEGYHRAAGYRPGARYLAPAVHPDGIGVSGRLPPQWASLSPPDIRDVQTAMPWLGEARTRQTGDAGALAAAWVAPAFALFY